ncbi:MAG TPA: hypothetical protein VMB34_13370 [Acetobacteraceae bacterium]|nr:hypothetical protein [Acetobacteraceae bacterium]
MYRTRDRPIDQPLEIAFHNLQPSPAIEAELRRHVDKLERRCRRLVGCRVSEPSADHGSIRTSTGSQWYFHRDSVTNGPFEVPKQGEIAHYVEAAGDAGPVGAKVRLAAGTEN